jgi:hypothetical protein
VPNGGRWDVKWHKVPGENNIEWEARVYFRDPAHEYTLTGKSDKTQFNIPVPLPGRARLSLTQAGIPWDVIQQLEVAVDYANPKADPKELHKVIVLTEQKPEAIMDEVIWTQWEPPFLITPKYLLKNGNELPGDPLSVKTDFHIVHSPFKEWLNVPVQAKWTTPEWDVDIIDLEYRDQANNYSRLGQITLSEEGGWRLPWAMPLIDPTKRTFRYTWTRRLKDGSQFSSADVPGNPPDGWLLGEGNTVLIIGDPVLSNEGDMLRVDFSKLIFLVKLSDGGKVTAANLHIKYKDPVTGVVDQDDALLDNTDPNPYLWRQFIRKPDFKKYTWWAEYYVTEPAYRKIDIPPKESEAEAIVLEPPA